jgi:hypothetical protein
VQFWFRVFGFQPYEDLDNIYRTAKSQVESATMDLAQTLIRSVMRAFYDTKHILVVDALIMHSAYVFLDAGQ